MQLTENQITTILYEGIASKETTSRTVIPTHIPSDCIKAVDVSDLTPDERVQMQELLAQYHEYRERIMKQAFKFEDYVEQVRGVTLAPKWRTFKVTNIK